MATFYFVRHAKAGDPADWLEDDRLRPLTHKGVKQAAKLVTVLGRNPISAVFSSPYLRCVQTVEPLARALRLEVRTFPELAVGGGLEGAYRFLEDPALDQVVLCTHADILWELVEDLAARHVLPAFRNDFDKGSTWVVEVEKRKPVSARHIPAP